MSLTLSLHFNNCIFWTPLLLAQVHGLAVLLWADLHTLQGVLAHSDCNGGLLARSTRPAPIPYLLLPSSSNKKTPDVNAGSPSNKDSPLNLVLADHSGFDHLVAFASFDGDFLRLDFLGLRQAYCEHANLVIGLNLIGLDPGGE